MAWTSQVQHKHVQDLEVHTCGHLRCSQGGVTDLQQLLLRGFLVVSIHGAIEDAGDGFDCAAACAEPDASTCRSVEHRVNEVLRCSQSPEGQSLIHTSRSPSTPHPEDEEG